MNRLIWKDTVTVFNKTPLGYVKTVLRNVYYAGYKSARNTRSSTENIPHYKCIIKHVYVKADGDKTYIPAEKWKAVTDEADYDKFWTAVTNESYISVGETDTDNIETLRNQGNASKVISVETHTHGTPVMRGIVLKWGVVK